ncbi:MAG: glycoside hydrolase family 9 protein, partial [Pirellulales bacterium]
MALRLDLNVESIGATVWVRRSADQPVLFQAVWTTRRQRRPVVEIHRDSTTEPVEKRAGWEKFSLPVRRPADAIQVQLVLETSGSEPFHIDAVELFFQRRPEQKLLVNQLGFEPHGKAKQVVLQSTVPMADPPAARVIDLATFREVLTVPWERHGYVPQLDYHYWSADFSELQDEGNYVVVSGTKHARIDSVPFAIRSGLLLQRSGQLAYQFFYQQRCGVAVAGVHAACHTDDGRLPDGTWRDLAGGWHDAGDYNKYNGLTPASIRALTLTYDRQRDYFDCWDEDRNGLADIVDEAAWGAEWIDKMLDPESLELLDQVFSGYRYWGRPEAETDGQPDSQDERPVRSTSGDRAHLVAGYARLGRLLQQSPDPRVVDRGCRYVVLSVRLFEKIGGDLLTLHALHRATGDAKYDRQARQKIANWLDKDQQEEQQPEQQTAQQTDTQHFAELAKFALSTEDSVLKTRLRPLALRRVRELAALCEGPFQVAKRRAASGKLIYCRAVEDVNDWYVGESAYRL